MFYIFADGAPLYIPGNRYKAVTEPKVIVELGKTGSLTCGLPPGNDLYGELNKLRSKIECKWDEHRIFSGRLLSEEKDFLNIRKIYCEGILSYFVDSVQKTEAYSGTTHALFRQIVTKHNERVEAEKQFKIGNIEIEDRPIIISGQSDDYGDSGEIDYRQIAINSITNEWATSLDMIQNCIIDYCGGYLRAREESDGLYVDILLNEGTTIDQEIEFGVNLLDLTEEITAEELFTVLVPLGDENLTISSVNDGSDELVDEEAVKEFGRIVRTHVFDNVNQASTLLENGRRYLENEVHIPRTFTISAIDLHFLNPDMKPIHVGDRVKVKSAPHGIQDVMLCTRIEYDLENAENTLYTFGNPKQSLTERYRKDKRKMQESATRGAGSGSGGASEAAKQEATDYVYKEWIDYDPDNPDGHISLGGLVEQYLNSVKILEEQVGIDLSGSGANVNIYAFRKEYDEFTEEVQSQRTQIDLKLDDAFSQIDQTVTYITDVEGVVNENYASLTLRADELGSSIIANADRIELNAEDIVSINAEIFEINAELLSVKKLIAEEIEAVYSNIDYAISESISTKNLTVSDMTWTQSLTAGSASIGSLKFNGSDVSKTTIPVVTSFTQASGKEAATQNYTFLTTAIGTAMTHQPLAGKTTTF